jgi:histidinol-phosphatase
VGPSLEDIRADLDLAISLADIADPISMARFRADDLVVETKPDLTPVSEADRSVEQAIRAELARVRPEDGILGEEFGTQGSQERRWVIDPIDGTKNYVRGVPVWSTLIGLMRGDEVVIGVVSAPALGRRWWAGRGLGAWATDPATTEPRRLQVSRVSTLRDASFSFSDTIGWAERGASAGLQQLTSHTWRQRAYGDFWSHMMVAEGAVDIAAEPQLETYDMAALIPIVNEAGGRITSFDGGSALGGGSAVTTNGLLHDAVIAALTGQIDANC